jgi:hypothetical protein
MSDSRLTLALGALTGVVLLVSIPGALRENMDRGEVYLFSWRFLAELPKRLAGPGRFRFVLQPALAALLGARDGIADARAGRSPYLMALLRGTGGRRELARSTLTAIVNLLLMGVLLDAVFQWAIYGVSHPGAALVVGPLLIAAPYSLARALANRAATNFGRT